MAVPFELVTATTPVPELPTTATICVAVLEVMDATGTPPIVTAVAPAKLTPLIVIVEPGQPLDGEKPDTENVGTAVPLNITFLINAFTVVPPNYSSNSILQ